MYTKLTKTIRCEDGSTKNVCSQYGTEMCHIHSKSHGCINCPMYNAIIEQLAALEDLVCEVEQERNEIRQEK